VLPRSAGSCPTNAALWLPSRRAGPQRLGGHVEQCIDCGTVRIAYNSCRDRHCPKCQGLARAQWLADRQADLLTVPYFHVVWGLVKHGGGPSR
jgi:Transposase zinc-binding domain